MHPNNEPIRQPAIPATGYLSPPSAPNPLASLFRREKNLSVLVRRWYVVLAILALGGIVTFVLRAHIAPEYIGSSTVLMVNESPPVNNNGVSADAPVKPIPGIDLPTLVRSPGVTNRVAADLGLHGKDATNSAVQRRIWAKMNGDYSAIMPIQFTALTPSQAVAGANAVATELANYYRSISTSRFDALISDLQHQVAQRREQLRRIDAALQRQKSQDPFVSAKEGSQPLSDQLLKLTAQRDEAEAALRADTANAGITARRSQEVRDAARRELASGDQTYLRLQSQYARDNAELQHALASYGPEYPGLPELKDVVAREKAGLAEHEHRLQTMSPNASPQYAAALGEVNRANALAAADQARVAEIDHEIAAMRGHVSQAGPTAIAVAALTRDRDAAEAAYNVVSGRLAMAFTQRAESAAVGSVVVMERARQATAAPMTSTKVLIAANVVLFVWLAIAAAFLVDAWDLRLRDARVVEDVYRAPVLVTVGRGLSV